MLQPPPQPSRDCCFNLPLSLRPPASRNSSKHLNKIYTTGTSCRGWGETVGAARGRRTNVSRGTQVERERLLGSVFQLFVALLSNLQKDTVSHVSDIAAHGGGISVSFCLPVPLSPPSILSVVFPRVLWTEGGLKRCTASPLLAGAATMRCFPLHNSITHQLFRGPEIKQFASPVSNGGEREL